MIVFLIASICLLYLLLSDRVFEFGNVDKMALSISFFGVFVIVFTEILSAFSAISTFSISAVWILIDMGLMIVIICRRKSIFCDSSSFFSNIRHFALQYKWIILLFVIMLPIVILVSQYVPDSLTYHLPRVMHWIQNRNINHFATVDIRQICSPPFCEILDLHIYLLTRKRDIFLNLPQFFSYISSGIFVWKISKNIGCDDEWAFVASLIYWSIPITMIEAFTTQTDNVSAMFFLVFIYYLSDNTYTESSFRMNIMAWGLGTSAALGYLAKPSNVYAMIVFAIGFVIKTIICSRKKTFDVLSIGIKSIVLAGLLIIPDALRNIKTFSRINVNTSYYRQLVETRSPRLLFICFIKNFLNNFSNGYLIILNGRITEIVEKVANILHVDVNDPAISYYSYNPPGFDTLNADRAINAEVTILILVAVILCVYQLIRYKRRVFDFHFICALLSMIILFSSMKYSDYRTRYEIGYFAVLCPGMSYIFMKCLKNKFKYMMMGAIYFVSVSMMINCLFIQYGYAKMNFEERNNSQYYYFPLVKDAYRQYSDYFRTMDYQTIGLVSNAILPEYQIWNETKGHIRCIEYVDVNNESRKYENDDYVPQVILYHDNMGTYPGDEIRIHGNRYICEIKNDTIGFWIYGIANQ